MPLTCEGRVDPTVGSRREVTQPNLLATCCSRLLDLGAIAVDSREPVEEAPLLTSARPTGSWSSDTPGKLLQLRCEAVHRDKPTMTSAPREASRDEPPWLDQVVAILKAARKRRSPPPNGNIAPDPLDPAELRQDLYDLFSAMGLWFESDLVAEVWGEPDSVDHKALAKRFAGMARAPDPLAEALRHDLLGALQHRWRLRHQGKAQANGSELPSLQQVDWSQLKTARACSHAVP